MRDPRRPALLATGLLFYRRGFTQDGPQEPLGEVFSMVGEAIEADHQRRALALDRQNPLKAVLGARKRLDVANRIVAAKLCILGLHRVDAQVFRQERAKAQLTWGGSQSMAETLRSAMQLGGSPR